MIVKILNIAKSKWVPTRVKAKAFKAPSLKISDGLVIGDFSSKMFVYLKKFFGLKALATIFIVLSIITPFLDEPIS